MAVSEIDKHRRRWEENPKGLTFAPYADALRKVGEAEQALDVLRAGLEYHPDYIPANIVLGRCHLDLGDDAAAGDAFERVLGLDPENVIALKALADVNERAQHWPEATKWLNLLLSVDRGNDAAREQLARVQIAEHDASLRPVDAVAGLDVVYSGAEPAVADEVPNGAASAAPVSELPGLEQSVEVHMDAAAVVEPLELERQPEAEFTPLEVAAVSPLEPVIDAAPSGDFVTEEPSDTFIVGSASSGAGSEFAVDDAAESFRSAAEPQLGEVHGADARTQAPSWAEMGTGEFVPAIFAGDAPEAPTSSAPLEPMGGLELDRPADNATFASGDAAEVTPALIEGFEAGELSVASIDETVSDDVAPAWSAESVEVELSPLEAAFSATDEAEAVTTAVAVPSPVAALALEHHELRAMDQAARRAGVDALSAWRDRSPVDVLAAAPQADPAVVAELAAAQAAQSSVIADEDVGPVWEPWTWGELDPDLYLLESIPAYVPLIAPRAPVAPPVAEAPEPVAVAEAASPTPETPEVVPSIETFAPVAETTTVAPELAASAEDDSAAVPPGFAAPVLVTAAMAALYEGQGHLREALATYRELEERAPGAHRDRIAQLEQRLAAVPAPPVYAARLSGGQPVREFFGAVLRTMPPALVTAGSSAGDDGLPLRKADEPVSLGRLFGEEQAPRPHAVAARTASFDEFYGAAAPAAEAGGRDDLEQFHAWLQGLKT